MTASGRKLRSYIDADLPALADLWVAAWRETGFDIDFEARRTWLEGRLRDLRANDGAIVVGLGAAGRPAGFVALDRTSGYLDQLCVAPAERGSGLACELIGEAKRLSPGVVELDVNEANRRALRFYVREGFQAVTRGASDQSGLPTLRMRWIRALERRD